MAPLAGQAMQPPASMAVNPSARLEARDQRVAAARLAHQHGIAVMPLKVKSKQPAQKGWTDEPFPPLEQAAEWAGRANIGFRTGEVSARLLVIDLDPGADPRVLGDLPPTVTVLTGRTDPKTGQRGRHLYFRTTQDLGNSAGKLGRNIDTRGEGGFVVAPGSVHPKTGQTYEFAPGLALGEVPIAHLPQHVVDRLLAEKPPTQTTVGAPTPNWTERVPLSLRVEAGQRVVDEAEPAVSGEGGDKATFKVACDLVIGCGLPRVNAIVLMTQYNERCVGPWKLHELEHKVDGALELGEEPDPKEPGRHLAPFAREVVEALGASVRLDESEAVVVLPDRTVTERFKSRNPAARESKLLGLLRRVLPGVNHAVLRAAAEDYMEDPPSAGSGDDDPDVIAIGTRRLKDMPADIRKEAEALARDPKLIERIADAYRTQGLVGLTEIATACYLVAVSRLYVRPLACLLRGPRSSGKSHIVRDTHRLMPDEAKRVYTEVTPKALYHVRPGSFKHRLVALGERGHENSESLGEGTKLLRELLEDGIARQRSVSGDGSRLGAEHVIEGPIAMLQSTASDYVFREDLSRVLVAHIQPTNEDRRRIGLAMLAQAQQSRPAGQGPSDRIIQVHHAFQRMLQRVDVILPKGKWGSELLALIPDSDIDYPRKLNSLLGLVRAAAIVHQYQRERNADGQVIAAVEDVQLGMRLVRHLHTDEIRLAQGGGGSAAIVRVLLRHRDVEFTATDVGGAAEVSARTARRWLETWEERGLVRMASEATGATPARYVFTDTGKQVGGPLPEKGGVDGKVSATAA